MYIVFRKVSLLLIVTIALAGAALVGGVLTVIELVSPAAYTAQVSDSMPMSAASWLIFDVATGEVLLQHNAGAVLPIASITKLPAAATFYEYDSMWATTSVQWQDVAQEGRSGKLQVGEEYMFHTLLFPLLLESSNDAAHVYSRSDTELIARMNMLAADIGLTSTSFADSSGLSGENMSSAYELRDLTRYIYTHHRHLIDITSLHSYVSSTKGWINNNPFAADASYVGGKHGYTPVAGYTAVALFDETLKNTSVRRLGYVILGSDSLGHDMDILRTYTQNNVSFQ